MNSEGIVSFEMITVFNVRLGYRIIMIEFAVEGYLNKAMKLRAVS